MSGTPCATVDDAAAETATRKIAAETLSPLKHTSITPVDGVGVAADPHCNEATTDATTSSEHGAASSDPIAEALSIPPPSLDSSSTAASTSSEAPDDGTGAVLQPTATTTGVTMSKNQLKKQRRWDKLVEIKKRRKLQDKQVKLERAKVQGRDIAHEQAVQEAARLNGENRLQRRRQWERVQAPRIQQSFQVCIDCAFESHMSAKEINSLALQIRYCYSLNKRNDHPIQLTTTSIDPNTSPTLRHLQNVSGFDEWSNWAFTTTPASLEQHYASNLANVVYLTSDSDSVLHTLDNSKTYVIGGIVDRNRLKYATLERAKSMGVATARLPIDEHLDRMDATKVLTVNHVFELLLQARTCQQGDWKLALLQVLPSRKDAKAGSNDIGVDDNRADGVNPKADDDSPLTT